MDPVTRVYNELAQLVADIDEAIPLALDALVAYARRRGIDAAHARVATIGELMLRTSARLLEYSAVEESQAADMSQERVVARYKLNLRIRTQIEVLKVISVKCAQLVEEFNAE